jgi:lysine-specific demethylase 8
MSDAVFARRGPEPEPIHVGRLASPPSVEEFERAYVKPGQPVILRGLNHGWPALESFTLDALRRRYGNDTVLATGAEDGWSVYDQGRGYTLQELPLAEALDGIEAARRKLPGGTHIVTPFDRYLGRMFEELVVPPYAKGRIGFRSRIWISAEGVGTYLHRDFDENVLVQVHGRKRITLLPPDEWRNIYPFSNASSVPNLCPVDFDSPNFERFPRAASARRVVVELEPGDGLFIPNRWWHLVRAVTNSVTINFWWASGIYSHMLRVAGWVGLRAAV